MSTVIGIGGHLASGKDAIGDYLVAEHGFIKLGMSDPLHAAMMKLNPLIGMGVRMREEAVFGGNAPGFRRIKETAEVRYADIIAERGYVEAKKEPEVRTLLQKFGTEVDRDLLGENVWVNIAVRRMSQAALEGHSIVITGIRFPNEVEMFRRIIAGSVSTIWVDRPGHEPIAGGHPSEASVTADDFGFTIHNDGTLEDLYRNVDKLFKTRI